MKGRVWDITDSTNLAVVAKEVWGAVMADAPQGRAAVLALSGDLGAGKTTFTQTLAALLGVTEPVTSPTFVIMKKYETQDARFSRLVHIDAYRLHDPEELVVLGWADELRDPQNLMVIEWAERVQTLIPPDVIRLDFQQVGETRTLSCTANTYGSED